MKAQRSLNETNDILISGAQSVYDGQTPIEVISTARARLKQAAERRQLRRELTSEYYQPGSEFEETIACASTHRVFDAIVTRNYYGSLILNARRALFIDVDVDTSGASPVSSWSETFDDLCSVLESERDEGFRIYRTAAGFRVLATAREFVAGSEKSEQLMNSVGADANFVELCGRQNNFRARLTPKPWRCGLARPPFVYPRITPEHERCFTNWLSQYENRSRERATCQFLAHIGSTRVHDCVAPIVEVHDRETKAQSDLPLA
jgi:hypothetical protein